MLLFIEGKKSEFIPATLKENQRSALLPGSRESEFSLAAEK
jgi:hypothetical protein